MRLLIESTSRFSTITTMVDVTADAMRDALRGALAHEDPFNEILFYFSGHGALVGSEFFFCGTDFDATAPHQTGLSHTELQGLFRSAEPELLVKIVDACASGTLLIKAEQQLIPFQKEGFRNVVQFSSSLQDQESFGGEPLSQFTRAFCEACTRKTEGPIFYGDVINILRDEFIRNEDQTPFFVSQGTGREMLVDDAAKLAPFREAFLTRWAGGDDNANDEPDEEAENGGDGAAPIQPPSERELLMASEQKMGGPETAKVLIDGLFDGVLARFGAGEFADYFELNTAEHSDFREPTARDFIIRVLARETRPDNFVTAEIRRVKKKLTPWERLNAQVSSSLMMLDPEWTDQYDLELNCKLDRAQLRLTLKPLYRTLKQLVLVLTCAPSLERCYVFEIVTQHSRTDWDSFDYEGDEIVRRWYKLDWDQSTDYLVERICIALEDAVRDHISKAAERLSKE